MKSNNKSENKKVDENVVSAENNELATNETQNTANVNLPAKTTNKKSDKKNKNKNENVFVRFFKKIGRSFKGMAEEMKKVTWPTFKTTLKSTGVVLVFVAIFLIVLMAIDALFGFGFNQLIGIQG